MKGGKKNRLRLDRKSDCECKDAEARPVPAEEIRRQQNAEGPDRVRLAPDRAIEQDRRREPDHGERNRRRIWAAFAEGDKASRQHCAAKLEDKGNGLDQVPRLEQTVQLGYGQQQIAVKRVWFVNA
jgi:hypothetical protein